jgi:glyoxylase-like metal-dependent hydrolase (beta-lactamase superfamily II)
MQRPGIDDIESRLKQVGYTPEDVDIVIFTHLHWDHVFYIEKFTKARFIVNEIEWEYAHNPIPLHYKSYCRPIIAKDGDVTYKDEFIAPYDIPGVKERFEFVKGETEIVPGVSVYESFGHCPGHQTVVVQTEEGPYFCVGDSVFVMGNIDADPEMVEALHYDITPPGRFVDLVAAWRTIEDTIRRCNEAGVDPHKHLLLAHDLIIAAAVEKYEAEHDGKLPVIGCKDGDFPFEKYSRSIIEKEAKKAAAKAETKYF